MAGICIRRNSGRAFTNNSGIIIPTPAVFHVSTLAPARTLVPSKGFAPTQAFALTFAPAFAPGPPERYIDKDLQGVTKLAPKSFIKSQKHGQLQANSKPFKQTLKVWFFILY